MDQKRETCRKVQSAVHATMLAHPCLACGVVSTGRRLPPARAVQAPGPCRDTHVTHLGCYCCCFAQTGIQKQQSQLKQQQLLCLARKSSLGKAALSPTWKQLQGDLSHSPGFFLPGRGGATQANWTLKGQETAWSQATFVVFVTWRPKSLH